MIVIPAIDIKDGLCVRLNQGRMSEATIYSQKPADVARNWFEKGAERLHLVDLDGAVNGKPVNKNEIREIVKSVPVPIQLGGGVRNIDTIKAYLELGIQQIILGTAAYKDPDFVKLACKEFPGNIIIGIDAKKDVVAVEGWTEETNITPVKLAKSFESVEISQIIYTDIHRDGMRTGPNIEATETLAKAVKTPVIASGGISCLEDIAALLPLAKYGVAGMITGRALYEGNLDLTEAIKLTKK